MCGGDVANRRTRAESGRYGEGAALLSPALNIKKNVFSEGAHVAILWMLTWWSHRPHVEEKFKYLTVVT